MRAPGWRAGAHEKALGAFRGRLPAPGVRADALALCSLERPGDLTGGVVDDAEDLAVAAGPALGGRRVVGGVELGVLGQKIERSQIERSQKRKVPQVEGLINGSVVIA